jgi:hypothetical protein
LQSNRPSAACIAAVVSGRFAGPAFAGSAPARGRAALQDERRFADLVDDSVEVRPSRRFTLARLVPAEAFRLAQVRSAAGDVLDAFRGDRARRRAVRHVTPAL